MVNISLKGTLIPALLISAALPAATCLDCSSHPVLRKFELDKHFLKDSAESLTPPSKTKQTWWLNPCSENKKNGKELPNECKGDDIFCEVTYVRTPELEKDIVTKVIDFSKNIAYSVEDVDSQLILTLKGTKWGSSTIDARIQYQCNTNMVQDKVTFNKLEENVLNLAVEGPSGCLKDEDSNDNDGDNNNDDDGKNNNNNRERNNDSSGFSWFTWLIIYALLFTIIYLMIVSYMNTRGGSFDDFRGEFIERTTQFVTSLPTFFREVVAKIFGGSSSAQRGGYSAV
ncbi:type II membrane protein [Maudiozyma exigua]|uniref:Autophagy-related protein 27 n=1 Tax=Maudiozyma exigua TaxID=34358 RepID=A0A9P6WGY3_MAUEX|nr:type II membrane protein [Kazachstania exigua]